MFCEGGRGRRVARGQGGRHAVQGAGLGRHPELAEEVRPACQGRLREAPGGEEEEGRGCSRRRDWRGRRLGQGDRHPRHARGPAAGARRPHRHAGRHAHQARPRGPAGADRLLAGRVRQGPAEQVPAGQDPGGRAQAADAHPAARRAHHRARGWQVRHDRAGPDRLWEDLRVRHPDRCAHGDQRRHAAALLPRQVPGLPPHAGPGADAGAGRADRQGDRGPHEGDAAGAAGAVRRREPEVPAAEDREEPDRHRLRDSGTPPRPHRLRQDLAFLHPERRAGRGRPDAGAQPGGHVRGGPDRQGHAGASHGQADPPLQRDHAAEDPRPLPEDPQAELDREPDDRPLREQPGRLVLQHQADPQVGARGVRAGHGDGPRPEAALDRHRQEGQGRDLHEPAPAGRQLGQRPQHERHHLSAPAR
mmetsp:Transcript_44856/g.118540  ORF Transcript_44856/g.118540 Transcript_44856/m.118540 type:complete len:418 (+) Transcript_44856:348-1601(+)